MTTEKVVIIGLGYVGIPLAVALAKHVPVVGFDVKKERVAELKAGHDRTGEVTSEMLAHSNLTLTDSVSEIEGGGVYIITVPTPVDTDSRPDLGAVRNACDLVGGILSKGSIVVLESTVYPGVTEDICGPILEQASGLVCGRDFFLGYSPERVNPGDREHTVDRITKVVAGQTPEVTETLAKLYGAATSGGVFRARDIRTAEAAKVIENAQRDINIAFINEITQIFQKAGLSVFDVLEAAATKWNFLGFQPGLVGGHCIGIDPFYLARWAQDLGHDPEIILAGRRLNDGMGEFIAKRVDEILKASPSRDVRRDILVLGLTFKEDVPDLRNSRVVDIITGLRELGYSVCVHDPLADREEAKSLYGIELVDNLACFDRSLAAVIGAVAHKHYRQLSAEKLERLLIPGGLIADVKGIWRELKTSEEFQRWQF